MSMVSRMERIENAVYRAGCRIVRWKFTEAEAMDFADEVRPFDAGIKLAIKRREGVFTFFGIPMVIR